MIARGLSLGTLVSVIVSSFASKTEAGILQSVYYGVEEEVLLRVVDSEIVEDIKEL